MIVSGRLGLYEDSDSTTNHYRKIYITLLTTSCMVECRKRVLGHQI